MYLFSACTHVDTEGCIRGKKAILCNKPAISLYDTGLQKEHGEHYGCIILFINTPAVMELQRVFSKTPCLLRVEFLTACTGLMLSRKTDVWTESESHYSYTVSAAAFLGDSLHTLKLH